MLEQAGMADAVAVLPPDGQPLVIVKLELQELSSDTVPDSVFAIPRGFKEASVEDVMNGMTSAFTGATQEKTQAAGLTLRVEPRGKDLLVTWNKDSASITSASQGELSIDDGDRHENYHMGASQLKTGSLVYTPVNSNVSFQLKVTGTDQSKTATESVSSSRSPATLAPEDKPPGPPAK
ncbi:MAG: hypothetical protein ACLQKA_16205 [Bryobacteraceae bacterium]